MYTIKTKYFLEQLLILILVACAKMGTCYATVVYNDGGTHLINSTIVDNVSVDNNTTVEVNGGQIIGQPYYPNGSSAPGGLTGQGGSSVTVTSGLISGGDTSNVGGDAVIFGDGTLVVNGGTLQGGDGLAGGNALRTFGSASVSIFGGAFLPGSGLPGKSILAFGSSILNISGGYYSGSVHGLSDTIFNIYGYNLIYSGDTLGGLLTGFWNDDTPLSMEFLFNDRAQLNLYDSAVVPAPSAILLMGSGILGLASMARRKKVA